MLQICMDLRHISINVNNAILPRCAICLRPGTYNAKGVVSLDHHHNSYFPEDIILLCRACHTLIHSYSAKQIREMAKNYVRAASMSQKYSHNWEDSKRFYRRKKLLAKLSELTDNELLILNEIVNKP